MEVRGGPRNIKVNPELRPPELYMVHGMAALLSTWSCSEQSAA